MTSWLRLARATARGGKRVKWDDVLAFPPARFGVPDVMKHPGAASKGRAQVYPALNRWEATKRVKRVGKGIYEKAGSTGASQGGAGAAAKRGSAKKRAAAKKATAGKKRGRPAKAAEAKVSRRY